MVGKTRNGTLEKSGYSFEAESDYHEWDAACDMIEALESDLGLIRDRRK